MTLKNKLATLTQEFTKLKEKILAKLSAKDNLIQSEKDSKQETIRQLETTLKETKLLEAQNSTNEQVLAELVKDFQELIESIDQA